MHRKRHYTTADFSFAVRIFHLLDDLEAGKFLALLFVKGVGNKLDLLLKARNEDILERVGALLRAFYRVGKAVDAVFHLGKADGQPLYALVKA